MLARATRNSVLMLAFLSATLSVSAIEGATNKTKEAPSIEDQSRTRQAGQESIDPTGELYKLRERVGILEGELKGFRDALTASIQATDRYGQLLTYVAGAVTLIFALIGSAAAYWIQRMVQQAQRAHSEVEEIQRELFSTVAIARAVPALLRSNLEEKDPARKKLHASEAYQYIVQAETKGQVDSHLLNWKAYTLRRMEYHKAALAAARQALSSAKPGDGQRARALYNIACYSCAFFPGNEEEALEKLEEAILIEEWYKPVARQDSDFDSLRKNPKFKDRLETILAT